jgi:hypothetical protein
MHPANQRNKLIIITALVTIFITSLAWIGIGATAYWLVTRESPPFALEVAYPDVVETGETFTLDVKITNEGANDLKLAELDLYDTFLDGFEVIAVSPKPRTKERVFGIVTYGFSRNLKPTESMGIEIELRAKETGLWLVGIDAYTPTLNYVSEYAEIEVVDATPAPETEE